MRERVTTVLYVRGNAYLKAGRGSDAVQAFQRLLDLKSLINIDPIMPLARLAWPAHMFWRATRRGPAWLIRISWQCGKTRTGYSLLREVKAEYAKLQ